MREDWEASIVVQVNSHFDLIGILNIPQVSNNQNPRQFYLYSTRAAEFIKSRSQLQGHDYDSNGIDSMPLIIKRLPKEGLIQHGRNTQLKKDMYYIVQPPGFSGYGQCLRLDKYGKEVNPEHQIVVENKHIPYNQFDIWCYSEPYMKGQPTVNGLIDEEEHVQRLENDFRKVLQICSIDTISLQLELITKIPRKISLNRYDYIVKSSDTFQQQQGQWPFFAYNLGIEKIALIHLTRQERIREYIFKIQNGHKFLCFVEFNSYGDIGFFAEGLLIEGCIRICFLTEEEDSIRLNLLLVDPYHKPMQFCYFISSYVVPIQDFICGDMIEACFVIPSKRSQEVIGKDKEFNIYLITQYKKIIKRTRFKQADPKALEDDDSDFGMNFSDVYVDNYNSYVAKQQNSYLEQVYMQLDEKNFLYYVSRSANICKIMEINPKKSNIRNHQCIYELKAEMCFGFSVSRNGKQFVFIDECKAVFVLERLVDSRKLRLISENHMNETFESDFQHKEYDPQIISPDYIISSNKIFYLWEDDPYPNGIFQMENLSESEKNNLHKDFQGDVKWFQGPVSFSGSNQFGAVDRVRKFYAYLKVMTLPDSTTHTIMVDNMNQIDMSTYLSTGDILIRCGYRYLIFDRDGFFKSQVLFGDSEDTKGEIEQLQSNLDKKEKLKNKNKKEDKDHIQIGLAEQGLQDEGNSSDEFEQIQCLGQHNKNELLQFSLDNTKFLFLNRLSGRMKVYELKQIKNDEKQTEIWQFQKMYTLDQKNSELLKDTKKFMHGENKFQFRDYLEKCLTIKVENDGSVVIMLISQPDRKDDENMAARYFEVVISIFRVEIVNKRCKVITQNTKMQYDRPDSQDIELCHKYELEYHEQSIIDNQMIQDRFPSYLKDRTENDIIHDKKQYLEDRRRRLIHGIISDDCIVIWQGAWINCYRIASDKGGIKLNVLRPLEVKFNSLCEIMRVVHTKISKTVHSGFLKEEEENSKEVLQILVKQHSIDQYDNKYLILTWDIINNEQISIMEVEDEQNEMLEFNLMKGMHIKLNYFQNKYAIHDLDTTIPISVVRNMQEQADHQSYIHILRLGLKFDNQRKIYEDNLRYLQIMRPRLLVFSYSYIHLRKWRDIKYKKDKVNLFKACVSLEDFMVDFDGQSMFHVYVKKSDIIQFVHDSYMEKRRAGKLTDLERVLPLLIMNIDKENYTALFRCIQFQNYKSFELLVSMLTGINNIFVTRNIIRSLPVMLTNESDAVLRYFDYNLYTPMQFEEPQMLPWPESLGDQEELIFPTNTTVLSKEELLEQILKKQKTVQNETTPFYEEEEEEEILEDEQTKLRQKIDEIKVEIQKQQQIEEGNKTLRSRQRENILITQVEDNSLSAILKGKSKESEEIAGSTKNKRVLVRVIDFDFIFQNDNSTSLITILSAQANRAVLTRHSIKVFIRLMWSEYQAAIFWRGLVIYVIYMAMFIDLCGMTLPQFWNEMKQRDELLAKGIYLDESPSIYKAIFDIIIAGLILIYLGKFELGQFIEAPAEYFGSPWNVVDASQMIINGIILIYSIGLIGFNRHIISQQYVITLGAYGSCLMWIKMFYWMRLFSSTAKYVNLIMCTIQDIAFFMVMVLIIIITFATFFFIINVNAVNLGLTYVPDYGLSPFINSFVSTYFITIGEFSYDSFSTGPNVTSCWIMFISATFFNCVVFMNMLVAIMGQTFAEVTAAEEENGLYEQISLINDYVPFVDHAKTWKQVRYIMTVQVVEQTEETDANIRDLLATMEDNLDKKTERLNLQQQKKLTLVEEMLDGLIEQQAEIKGYMSQIISSVQEGDSDISSLMHSENSDLQDVLSSAQQSHKKNNQNIFGIN